MKILLISNYLASNQESMQRFSNMIKNDLEQSGHQVKVIRPKAILCKSNNAESGINKWLGYIDRFILFKWTIEKEVRWADVVHICDHSNAMYSKWIKNHPILVTCHDVLAIQSAKGLMKEQKISFTGKVFQKWISSGLRSTNHIACVSENTQEQLCSTLSIEKEKTSVIYNALNYNYTPMESKEAKEIINCKINNLTKPFFFHLGGNQWYKNRIGVVEIFSYLCKYPEFQEHKLIMAGKPWPNDLQSKINELDMNNQIIQLNDLSNEEIRAFYSMSETLLFPSLEEGFGWPIAEAQACGCLVVTSNRKPMTEVGGNAAIYIDPENPIEAAEIIKEKIQLKAISPKDSIENAKRFSNSAMINSYLESYNKINLFNRLLEKK
jgi:glycosyltransferase involved in cell wall biosynthesis